MPMADGPMVAKRSCSHRAVVIHHSDEVSRGGGLLARSADHAGYRPAILRSTVVGAVDGRRG
jgi:hypothetical protein